MTDELDKKIHQIQQSTKTVVKFLRPLHNKLRMKFRWYYNWHLHPYHRHVHYSALAVAVACAALVFTFTFAQKTHATASQVDVTDTTGATVINTGAKIYFSPDTYHSNVKIDNYTRQMSGYAWSTDLGWIDFANTGSSPANPVKADRAGHLSGKAKAINGGYIDFDASPTGANVLIGAGSFSGYAWSDDLGWINFSGVTASSYNPDLLSPDNSVLNSALNVSDGSTSLTTGNWYNFPNPSFSWTVPADHADVITPAGIAGYLVYFGTDNTANITLSDGFVSVGANNGLYTWQSGTTFNSSATLITNSTYYLKVVAVDSGGNPFYSATSSNYNLFVYKYDNVKPTSPLYVSASPSGYSRTNSFTFSWLVSGDNAAVDTGGSGLAKYQYKINGEENWHDVTGDAATANITLTDVATSGINTFDLQSVDTANNASQISVRTNFYFNNSAPTAPRSLTVTPTSSSTNAFSFTWTAPPGEIAGYYYSVNALPTISNTSYTTETLLAAGPYATQQGANTFYVVAKDNAGNYDFDSCKNITGNTTVDGCAKVDFTTDTTAPGIPTNAQAYDISDRDTKDYAVAIKWVQPTVTGAGFAGYDVYRSTDNTNFTKIGSSSSTIYADGDLSSQLYYYYVVAKDNAGQYSAQSSVVSVTPTGRFTSPPKLVSGPTVTVAPTSITVSWATDRASSSFVEIKNGNTFVSEQGQTEQTTDHTVKVVGLRSQENYSYNIRSTDIDGNTLTGDDRLITTANTPSVYNLVVSNITQSSAIINFKSTATATFTLRYGTTSDYGTIVAEDSTSSTTNHSIAISNLKSGLLYYFRVTALDADGNELRSENSFSTLPMPAVSKFSIQPDKSAPSTTLIISWQTNVPTTSTVKYSTDGTTFSEKSTSDLVTEHEIIISDLKDSNKYTIYASGRDQFGNVAESDKVSFDTPNDTRPPKVSGLVIESSNVGNPSNNKAQIAVSWSTDEPANSQVEYDFGLSGGEYTRKTVLDTTLTNHHLVIISDLDPGKPYHIRILTADSAGNLTKSGDNTVITGEVSRSALQIIINTMTNIFGWMGKWIR